MSEDWQARVAESKQVFHDLEGMTYEYVQVDVYEHPSGRFFVHRESLHVDADLPRGGYAWLEDPQAFLEQERARVAAREAAGKQAFFDVYAESKAKAAATPAPAAATPAPTAATTSAGEGESALAEALAKLLQRTGGFVIANEAGGRFIQFAGGVGEELILNVPKLDAELGARAAQAFAGQPFELVGDQFYLRFGTESAAAAAGGFTFLREVLGVSEPRLSFVEE